MFGAISFNQMVKCKLDTIFSSLSDPTRRDILQRVAKRELTVGEIAGEYDMSMAAISKHLKILEQAGLIAKRREGKHFFVRTTSENLAVAATYLYGYDSLWNARFDALEKFLKEERGGKD